MAQIPSIASILTTSKIREYLALNRVPTQGLFNSGTLDDRWGLMIYAIRKNLQYIYNVSPNDSNLINTTNYLYSLVAPTATVNTNLLTINLSAVAVSTTEIDLAWTAVPNATQYILESSLDQLSWGTIYIGNLLAFNNTGLTPATHYYYRIHATASGFTDSPYAFADATTQSVPVTITGYFYYNASDPYPTIVGGSDPFTYQVSYTITHNSPIVIPMPSASAPNQYLIAKVPIGETVKTVWNNDAFNFGTIPDAVWQSIVQFGGFTYYVTRVAASLNTAQTLILS